MTEKEKDQIKVELHLLLLLNQLCPDCLIYPGVDEKYAVANVLFRGSFALSQIVDCNHIHQVINESGKNCLEPKEIFTQFTNKGWVE